MPASKDSRYCPQPFQSDQIELPERLEDLIESLAEKVHDAWAAQRIEEGWSYGPERNDTRKENPCLVPYEELPDSEKEYDRLTAKQSIAAIVELGYTVTSPDDYHDLETEEWISELRDSPRVRDLHRVADRVLNRGMVGRAAVLLGLLQLLTKKAIQSGELLLAQDIARYGLAHFEEDPDLTHKLALTQVELGEMDAARTILKTYGKTSTVPLRSLAARVAKDASFLEADEQKRMRYLKAACGQYRQAARLNPSDTFPLINLAACLALSGDRKAARQEARKVIHLCRLDQDKATPDYYYFATLAEAHLIRGDMKEAQAAYRKAVRLGRTRARDYLSTRRQAIRLADALRLDCKQVKAWLPEPCIVIFHGHPYDPDKQGALRKSDLGQVSDQMRRWLRRNHAWFSYSSASAGSDILFLEGMEEHQGTTHIFLPWPEESFRESSVHPSWHPRFRECLDRAAAVHTMSHHHYQETSLGIEFMNKVMLGGGLQLAQKLGIPIKALAVWNGDRDAPGGTASFIDLCREQNIPTTVIPVRKPADSVKRKPAPAALSLFNISEGAQDIKSILFSDVVGYSRIAESQVPAFVNEFMRRISVLIAKTDHQPVINNTWGDALYAVFNKPCQAGGFALELRDLVRSTPWQDFNLPDALNIRIGLHAGPVFATRDPIIRQVTYTGFHISWAARIEPSAQPGEIFCSEEFAALSELDPDTSFLTTYVGTFQLAKKFDRKRLYKIQAAGPSPKR